MSDPVTRLNATLEGRYAIERELGEGGMATVYLADDLKHERKIALKVLKPELAAVVGAERFLAEIKTTANLQHPHILPLHDSGEADGFLYYVMPFVEGETLRQRIDREKQLGVKDALAITTKVADALDYAHERGVVHRDIKPANVLLSERGEPLVADFGIALAVAQAGSGRITETGLSLGTPHYMSPEQATGDRDVDPRSDVYALGCVLYEMLSGDPPFSASSAQAVLVKILTTDAPPITAVRRTVPPHVEGVLARALEKLPADRFESAAEFMTALDDVGFRYETVARTTAAPVAVATARTATSARRWTTALPWVVAAVATGVAAWSLGDEPAPAPVTRVGLTTPQGQEFSKAAMFLDQSAMALSPDGSQLVYRGRGDAGQTHQLWLRRLNELEATPIAGTGSAVAPQFSRDGQFLAFRVQERGVGVMPAEGGTPVWLEANARFAWGDDGAIYYTVPELPELRRWMPGSAESVSLGDIGVVGVVSDVLPGIGAILTSGTVSNTTMFAVDIAAGEAHDLGEGRRPRYLSSGHIVYRRLEDNALLVRPFDLKTLSATGPAVSTSAQVGLSGPTGAEFAVADDGTLVYASGAAGDTEQLVWLNRAGQAQLIDWIEPGGFEGVALSASGDSVVAAWASGSESLGEQDIWVFDLVGRSRLPLTRDGVSVRPQWHPTEPRISFIGSRDSRTWVMSITTGGSGVAESIVELSGMPADAWWTRNGRELLVRMPGASLRSIWRFDPGEHDAPEPWLDRAFNERSPEPSPDGNWLVYTSNQSGRDEVYAQPYPEGGRVESVSIEGGSQAMWSRDGGEVFFIGLDGCMWSATVTHDASSFVVESRERLFELDPSLRTDVQRRLFDVAPDGRFLFSTRVGGAAQAQLVLVRNWVQEVTGGR